VNYAPPSIEQKKQLATSLKTGGFSHFCAILATGISGKNYALHRRAAFNLILMKYF
jgi:hypothetical protein